ncbi:MAG: response regulator [Chloroflexi bacterium]|nr:MAG: response regulator [Chloroflexota bacterium]
MAARVLVVEDDEATRGALHALLDDAGYVCDEVADGERAVAVMRDARFDLVLLDLGLPGMSGADVHRHLRRDPRTRFLPIVFLTAHTDRAAKLAELEAGAEDFITKPYDADELLARVGAAVRRWSGLRNVNPLSGLPGNPTITEELESRLARSEHFALLYVDIDRFKEFNDHYGFTRGDRVITMLAEILIHAAGADQRFVGHIGGDDFVLLARAEEAEAVRDGLDRDRERTAGPLRWRDGGIARGRGSQRGREASPRIGVGRRSPEGLSRAESSRGASARGGT